MVSVVAHELEETTSDPNINAWHGSGNSENADNGSVANMHLGSRDYLVQQNWVNDSGGYCSLSYPEPGDALFDLCGP